jgi:hypothetical protein
MNSDFGVAPKDDKGLIPEQSVTIFHCGKGRSRTRSRQSPWRRCAHKARARGRLWQQLRDNRGSNCRIIRNKAFVKHSCADTRCALKNTHTSNPTWFSNGTVDWSSSQSTSPLYLSKCYKNIMKEGRCRVPADADLVFLGADELSFHAYLDPVPAQIVTKIQWRKAWLALGNLNVGVGRIENGETRRGDTLAKKAVFVPMPPASEPRPAVPV